LKVLLDFVFSIAAQRTAMPNHLEKLWCDFGMVPSSATVSENSLARRAYFP
jgi:hypothetical protein